MDADDLEINLEEHAALKPQYVISLVQYGHESQETKGFVTCGYRKDKTSQQCPRGERRGS